MSGNRVPSRADFLETKYGEKFNLLQKNIIYLIAAPFELEGAFLELGLKNFTFQELMKGAECRARSTTLFDNHR